MGTKNNNHKGKISLRYYLTFYILLLLIPILITLSIIDYFDSRMDLKNHYQLIQEQSENEIKNVISLVDSGYKMFGKTLDDELKKAFEPFIAAYKEAGNDPSKIDLEALKEKLGGNMDLYIINKVGVVVYSTYQTDIGLDFNIYPDFVDYLDKIRLGNSYSSDRITPEIRTGILRKYAYIPSPDHEYILELGLVSEEFKTNIQELDFTKVASELTDINPSLNNVRIFDRAGNLIGRPEVKVSNEVRNMVVEVYRDRESCVFYKEDQKEVVKYLFVDLSDPDYPTDVSKIVELTYSTRPMEQRLKSKKIYHISATLIAMLLGFVLTPIVAGKITSPIRKIVHSINRIAQGELDHKLRVKTHSELLTLEKSINTMVQTLKDNITKIKESEEKIRQYSQRLDELVEARTAELEEANEDLKAFAHSISHDLRAPLVILQKHASVLLEQNADRLDEKGRERAEKILETSRRIDRLIQDLLDYNYLGRADIKLEPVNLENLMEEVLTQIEPQINEKNAVIKVNEPLPDVMGHRATLFTVITNLVTNALKYVAPDVRPGVKIYTEAKNGWIRLWVEDNGIGIASEDQERIFHLFERVKETEDYSGTGIGLAIVRKGIQRMGGHLGLESEPGKGSKFWIELRRA